MLSCLLALTLPIQGVAAATMLRCAADQASVWHEDGHGPAQAEIPALHSGSHHHHHDVAATDAPAPDGATRGSADPKCSACAMCCIASALPATLPGFEATAPAEPFAPTSAGVDPLFLTGGPERPPRPSNA